MSTYRVEVTANKPPSVCVDFEDWDHEPTTDEIDVAIQSLAQDMTFDGYMAEHADEAGYIVTAIERYP